jgi:hypothetical protein
VGVHLAYNRKIASCTKSLRDSYVAHEPCRAWQSAMAYRMGSVTATGAGGTAQLMYRAVWHMIMRRSPCGGVLFSCGFGFRGQAKIESP